MRGERSGRSAVHGMVNCRSTVHLRAFGSVPPSDFCRGSCKKHRVHGYVTEMLSPAGKRWAMLGQKQRL